MARPSHGRCLVAMAPRAIAMAHVVLAVICACVLLIGLPRTAARANAEPEPEFTKLSQLSEKTVGTVLGTTYDQDMWNILKEGPTFNYYSEISEMLVALKYGRIDACCLDKPVAQIAVERNEGLAIMPEDAGLDANAIALPKNSPLTPRVNRIVNELLAEGAIDQLEQEWCETDEGHRSIDAVTWPCKNGTLVCAVDDATEPMSYHDEDGNLVGLEVELAYLVAERLDMDLRLLPMSFDAITASLNSDDIDMAIAGISITAERAGQFDLTDAYRSASVTLVTRAVGAVSSDPFAHIIDVIQASFFRRGHGSMLVSGFLVTLGISVVSVALGLVSGYGHGLLILALGSSAVPGGSLPGRRLRVALRRIAYFTCLAFERVMLEIPVVVVLLILRYVVFGLNGSPGLLVAVLGLAASLCAKASSIIREGIHSVGITTWEAALVLGYPPFLAMRRVMMPLARAQYAPALYAAIIQTVFDTSVVGLIAVHDITRMADLVRAHTTEALPTLVATTAVYLVLSYLLRQVLASWTKRRNAKERMV